MIECIFTLDYEIYGDGTGALKDAVYDPAQRLKEIFLSWNAPFVVFVEVAEIEKIDAYGADVAIDLVKQQIRDLYREGFEIGLHLHPQWSKARWDGERWILDYSEYNLCTLSAKRIDEIVGDSLEYLRHVLGYTNFAPLSFRAGNWLLQPTQPAAAVLFQNGIRIDSSVFKGGLQRNRNLDYRPALKNGYFWPFSADVNEKDRNSQLFELPIYSEMVPFWRVPTAKRLAFKNNFGGTRQRAGRLVDLLRLHYPLKFDFCRMTLRELTSMMGRVVREDQLDPASLKPIVAIGHTKDLTDPQAVNSFLAFLCANKIPVSTFETTYYTLLQEKKQKAAAV